jgi:hypothetical protein
MNQTKYYGVGCLVLMNVAPTLPVSESAAAGLRTSWVGSAAERTAVPDQPVTVESTVQFIRDHYNDLFRWLAD